MGQSFYMIKERNISRETKEFVTFREIEVVEFPEMDVYHQRA